MEGNPRDPSLQERLLFLSSNPLFSTIITLYIVILLYFPALFIFSPILISTAILLLFLLRLGASERGTHKEKKSRSPDQLGLTHELLEKNEEFSDHDLKRVSGESDRHCGDESGSRFDLDRADSFVEWDVRAPLEVIYEEYEGEEEGNEGIWEEKREAQLAIIEKYTSLSLYYPESDTDHSSQGESPTWDSPENSCFLWEEDDDDKEGLIEIELNWKKNSSEIDEDNLIEIDISPAR